MAICRCSSFHPRFELPCKHQSQHFEVTDKRPERMSKGSRLIALNQKVSGPGKGVRYHRPEQRVPWMPNHKRYDQSAQTEQRAYGMHRAITRIAVLMLI